MNVLTALMIGWGFFWLLVWAGLYVVFSHFSRIRREGDGDLLSAHRDDAEVALVCALMGIVAGFWIMAWALVRSIAA